ncbi:signal recognition particle-docking protein FtsY, partial [Pseudomonas piscis]
MFGSNDDKKTPAAAGEKKGLFGWLRKKPQEPVVQQPPVPAEPVAAPVIEPAPSVAPVEPVAASLAEPLAQPQAQPHSSAPVAPDLPLTPNPEHKPWLTLPVAEEPVALVEDVQVEHVTPLIPAVAPAPEIVAEAPVVATVAEEAPVAPVFVAPEPVA